MPTSRTARPSTDWRTSASSRGTSGKERLWRNAQPTSDTRQCSPRGVTATTSAEYLEDHFALAKLADGTKVLRLPYEGGALEMIVALPAKPGGLRALERSIDGDTVAGWIHRARYEKVDVYLPRFRLAPAALDLSADLRAVGMPLAFSDRADFSGLSSTKAASIGKVMHRAFVEVDEEGTVAAAATGVIMAPAGAAPPERAEKFNANHPFLFFIRDDRSGAVLFWGRFAHPAAG